MTRAKASAVDAATYLRVSTDRQTAENQRPDVDRIRRARGLRIVADYEEAESAAARRPEFDRMMDDARRGRFKVLVIWALDRFGRSMVANMSAVLELERLGVHVVSAREPWLDTTGPVRDLLLAIFSWAAEQESIRLGERTRAGMERARRTGKRIGRPRARFDMNAYDLLVIENPKITIERAARRLSLSPATLKRRLADYWRWLRAEDLRGDVKAARGSKGVVVSSARKSMKSRAR